MGVIRVFMPDGRHEKVRGQFRLTMRPGFSPELSVSHKGVVRKIDPIAIVFRGQKCVYSPRAAHGYLHAAERKFLHDHPEWGEIADGRPAALRVVELVPGKEQAAILARQIVSAGQSSEFV